MTLLFYDPIFLDHDSGPSHPERPDRLRTAWRGLEESGMAKRCTRGSAKPAAREQLLAVHKEDLVQAVEESCREGGGRLDVDTPVSPRSDDIARLAAGCAIEAVEQVLDGKHS